MMWKSYLDMDVYRKGKDSEKKQWITAEKQSTQKEAKDLTQSA